MSNAQQVAGIKACFGKPEPERMLLEQNSSHTTIFRSCLAGLVRYDEAVVRGRIGKHVCYTCGTQAILGVAKSLFLLWEKDHRVLLELAATANCAKRFIQ